MVPVFFGKGTCFTSREMNGWNLQINHPFFEKEHDLPSTSMIMFHVNLQWCSFQGCTLPETNISNMFRPFEKGWLEDEVSRNFAFFEATQLAVASFQGV